jgi:hypothetical protein
VQREGKGPGDRYDSATLFPQLRASHPGRQRRQCHRLPCYPRERFRLDLPEDAARAADAHEEIT